MIATGPISIIIDVFLSLVKMKKSNELENETTLRMHRGHHKFIFNHIDNNGEELSFVTDITVDLTNPKKQEITLVHEISLQSYSNLASIVVGIQITPAKLRLLADELEKEIEFVVTGVKK